MEADSIVAVVTPPGEGAVGIVRVSGPESGHVATSLFPNLLSAWRSHQMRHGTVCDPVRGAVLDDALGVLMRAPHSYTGEDVFEIHCHGNPLILDQVVRACLGQGCRAARPGEFTLRAFLNGRLRLSEAEAVVDVVRARTNAGLELALRQLNGYVARQVEPHYEDALGLLAHMEASVDFVEDDIPPRLDEATTARLDALHVAVSLLLSGSEQGAVFREGASLALAGAPNVGKSSLMNALVGTDRSIVTPIAGTTRDTIEAVIDVRGIAFRVVDTAGITETADPVEQIGVQRTREAVGTADVVLLVLDRSRPSSDMDHHAVAAVCEAVATARDAARRIRVVAALNKNDLPAILDAAPLLRNLKPDVCVECNALSPDGIESVRGALEHAALGGQREEFVVASVRHQDALARACAGLASARSGLTSGVPLDLVSFDVRAAVTALGEITGASVDDELLDRIFRDFCIGK